jgi:hypothetical protein
VSPLETAALGVRAHLGRLVEWLQLLTIGEIILMILLAMPVLFGLVELTLDFSAAATVDTLTAAAASLLAVVVLRYRITQTGELKRASSEVVRLLQATPTGAPRLAEVPCGCGRHNRYQYVGGGWEAAGPAPEAP